VSLRQKYTLVAINFWPEPTGNSPYNTDLTEALSEVGEVSVLTGVPALPAMVQTKHRKPSGPDEAERPENTEI